jgi:hypothetical protein
MLFTFQSSLSSSGQPLANPERNESTKDTVARVIIDNLITWPLEIDSHTCQAYGSQDILPL